MRNYKVALWLHCSNQGSIHSQSNSGIKGAVFQIAGLPKPFDADCKDSGSNYKVRRKIPHKTALTYDINCKLRGLQKLPSGLRTLERHTELTETFYIHTQGLLGKGCKLESVKGRNTEGGFKCKPLLSAGCLWRITFLALMCVNTQEVLLIWKTLPIFGTQSFY